MFPRQAPDASDRLRPVGPLAGMIGGGTRAGVDDADVVLGLYNGNAGWTGSTSGVGICHGELKRALDTALAKVRLIQLSSILPDALPEFVEYGDTSLEQRTAVLRGLDALRTAVKKRQPRACALSQECRGYRDCVLQLRDTGHRKRAGRRPAIAGHGQRQARHPTSERFSQNIRRAPLVRWGLLGVGLRRALPDGGLPGAADQRPFRGISSATRFRMR
jgi:hypothetical protein